MPWSPDAERAESLVAEVPDNPSLAIVAPDDGDTYRALYTVKFENAVYILHAFQKKSTKGIATPQHEIDLVRRRLADAEQHYRERQT
jgi:phage-related protein